MPQQQPVCRVLRVDDYDDDDDTDHAIRIELEVSPPPFDGRIEFLAAMPAERRASFTGSGLPLPNEQIALQGTSNRGHATATAPSNDLYSIVLPRGLPGLYHAALGAVIAPPMLHVIFRASPDGPRIWCRAPIVRKHPHIHHRSSLNYLTDPRRGPRDPKIEDPTPAAQDTLLFRTRYLP